MTCGTIFTPKRAWGHACSSRCRNAYHAAKRREEAIRAKAVELYKALGEIGRIQCMTGIANCWCGTCVARSAIKALKPPATPKELLERSKEKAPA